MIFDYGFLAECNDVFAKMYGFESPEEIIGIRLKDVLQIDNPDNWEYLRTFIRNNYRLTDGISTELDKFGNTKYFENNLVGIVEDGFLIRAWGTQRDITEKKQLELTLKQSEEKFRLLAESSLTGIYLIQDFKFAYVNEALAKTFGYEVEEIIGKLGPLDLTHPDDRPRVIENVNKRVAGEIESIRYDFKGLKKDGSVIYLEVHGRRIEYSGKIGVIGTLVDITSRKKAEEELVKLSEAVRNSPIAILITNRDGIIEYVNPKFIEATGYSQEEIVGNTTRILKSEYHTDEFYKTLWNTILNGDIWSGEILNRKKNGELFWGNLIIYPIKNNKGEITHFVAIMEDITEKNEMIQRLIEAKSRAEESDRLKSAFLANISHEVRTPLNAMLGFAQLLYLQPVTKDEVVSFAKIIYTRGQDLLRLFNDIIEISFIDSRQLIVSPRVDKVLPLLKDIYTTFTTSEEFSEKDVELRIGKSVSEDFEFSTDFFRTRQVLFNLIHNALKFTQKGFVEFGCSPQDDGNLLFYVKDTGIGIPESKKDYVFGRFQQLDTDFLTRPYQGLGLGLAISREIVNLLGGKIWFESTVGKGTTFYFTLPPLKLTTPKANAQTQKVKEPTEIAVQIDSERKLVFLVAEDEYTNLVALEKFLKRTFNCEILYAMDGSEAVEIAKKRKDIDLIIMDIRMPEKDGYTAFKEIRENKISVPIIALTAYAFPEDKKRILDTGFDDYIAKPFEYDDVKDKIKRVLSERGNPNI
jgi:PAS domain S-box-containing protein